MLHTEHIVSALAIVVFLGISGQWLAWRFRLPAIVLFLIFGIVAGPVTGLVNPDELFGNLLTPLVSLSVAIILFEGGINLRLKEIAGAGGVVRNLIVTGAIVSWAVTALAAYFFIGFDAKMAVLIGAILVVTGPTVIIPLLKHVRPTVRVGSILKWEGILIDPIGAMLAVLVFEAILSGGPQKAAIYAAAGFLKTIVAGVSVGFLFARVLAFMLVRHWIPDSLQNAASLMLVVGAFALSNMFQEESGLMATTVMGVVIANRSGVSIRHIVDFKETLRILLISCLFVILTARLRMVDLQYLDWGVAAFLATLILAGRPLSVFISTFKSGLEMRERVFLACVAPRGIVAAAVASVFALRLADAQIPQAATLVPVTFIVIIGTVLVYSLSARRLASLLGVRRPSPQGLLLVGANRFARLFAKAVEKQGTEVVLVDTNWSNVATARMEGLSVIYENTLAESVSDEIGYSGIGRMLSLTQNDEINSLAAIHFTKMFGRAKVYQLVPEKESVSVHLCGRILFDRSATYESLNQRVEKGAAIRATRLTSEFDFNEFKKTAGENATVLCVVNEQGRLVVCAADEPPDPKPNQTIVCLADRG